MMQRHVERALHLRRRPAELYHRSSVIDVDCTETLRCKPRRERGDVCIRWPVGASESRWREPLVIRQGRCVLLLLEQRAQRVLLRGAAREDKLHAIGARVSRNFAAVELRSREWMNAAVQRGHIGGIDALGNARNHLLCLCAEDGGD
jgi:hypothetical protein